MHNRRKTKQTVEAGDTCFAGSCPLPRPLPVLNNWISKAKVTSDTMRKGTLAVSKTPLRQHHARSWVRCDGDGERVILLFPYNPAWAGELASWPPSAGRHYNTPGRRSIFPDGSNDFPFTTLPRVVEFADAHAIPVPDEVRALVDLALARTAEIVVKPAEMAPNVYLAEDGELIVSADHDPALHDALKQLNHNRATSDAKGVHRLPLIDPKRLMEVVERFGLLVAPDAQERIDAEAARQDRNRVASKQAVGEPVAVPGLARDRTIKPFQWPAVHWTTEHRRVIIADRMGFGKTPESLAAIAVMNAYPAVVVCRPNLAPSWVKEIKAFFPHVNVWLAEGQSPSPPPVPPDTDIVVIGTAALGYSPLCPSMTPVEESLASARPTEVVDAARARKAVVYLLAKHRTAARVSEVVEQVAVRAGRGRMVLPAPRVSQIASGEGSEVTRRAEEILVRAAVQESQGEDRLFPWVETLSRYIPWKAVVFDEGQDGKEDSANRSQALQLLMEGVGTRINLSATSILNRPLELGQQLVSLGVIDLFGGIKAYKWRYCVDPEDKARGYEFRPKYTGSDNLEELHDRLCAWGIMVRRTDISLLGIPPLREHTLTLTAADLDRDTMIEYRKAESDVIAYLGEEAAKIAADLHVDPGHASVQARMRARNAEHFALLNTLRRLVAKAKRPYITAQVAAWVAAGEKVMVAAHHREEVTHYAKKFGGLRIQGRQSPSSVQADKERFQGEPVASAPVISVSIDAGGVGHTLTAARIAIQAEWPWGPGPLDQIAGRVHRFGQTRKCHHYLTLAANTIDEEMRDRVERKRRILDAVLDGKSLTSEEKREHVHSDDLEGSVVADIAWEYAMRGTGGRA